MQRRRPSLISCLSFLPFPSLSVACFASAVLGCQPRPPTLWLVGTYESGETSSVEIVSTAPGHPIAVAVHATKALVDVIDLSVPEAPTRVARHPLTIAPGEEVSSVALAPAADFFLAAIRGPNDGRVELVDVASGERLATLPAGKDPDSIVVAPGKPVAVVANEAEAVTFDTASQTFQTLAGSLTIVNFMQGPRSATARQVSLSPPGTVTGFNEPKHARLLERPVDWNGNGEIDEQVDFNRNERIDDEVVVVGTFLGRPVSQEEGDGELFLLPLAGDAPELLEPEYVAFSKDGQLAFVTLQENNGVAVLDVDRAEVLSYHGLGVTVHVSDRTEDDKVAFSETLTALREPDGISVFERGGVRYFVTADEGDTEPKASKTKKDLPTGGGRTVSVFKADGTFVADTGNQLDAAAARAGLYPDDRSDSKGVEPENLVTFEVEGRHFAAVGLERAGAVALVALSNPAEPVVEGVVPLMPDGDPSDPAPEGIAFMQEPASGRSLVLTANEGNGTVSVLEIGPAR